MDVQTAEATVFAATGRRNVADAVSWIAEGRTLRRGVAVHELLAALNRLDETGLGQASVAVAHLVRTALDSAIDTSFDLLGTDDIARPADYRASLRTLCQFTTSRTLVDLSPEAVAGAQAADPMVISALCQVSALSYRDLVDRVTLRGGSTPSEPTRPWTAAQVQAAFAVIDEIVRGLAKPRLPGAAAARPVELLVSADTGADGWAQVQAMFAEGVPYEVLLTQRAVGGAWLAHRNSTTGLLPPIMAAELCELLEARRVTYWRGTVLGGDVSKRQLGDLVGTTGEAGQVGLVTKNCDGEPALAIAIAVARDGGTARKSAGRLAVLPAHLKVPAAAVLLGPGWATRGETTDLVGRFDGRLFSERTLVELSDVAAALHAVTPHADNAINDQTSGRTMG